MDFRAIIDNKYNNSFVFFFERKYDRISFSIAQLEWLLQNWTRSFYYSFFYLAFVFAGRFFMRNRARIRLYRSLIAWNILHSIFSILGNFNFYEGVSKIGLNFFWFNKTEKRYNSASTNIFENDE